MEKIQRESRVPAITAEEFYNRIADADSRPVPEVLRESRPYGNEVYQVPVERFLSKDYHLLEVENLWKRVWQMVCREEEIPKVGDVHVYEVATQKYIVVRSAPDKIKAYPNSCLHRGRQIVDCDGHVGRLRCPFHGFTWDLEGRISSIPCAWEFSHIENPEEWHLPEAKVATWGGFVFINPDPNAEPLQNFLGDLDRHFARYPLDERYIAGHARKVVPCNWKVAQEAFLEAYHVLETHPQLTPQGSHTDMRYDVYKNYSRTLGVYYIPNAFTGFDAGNQDILDSVADLRLDQERVLKAKDGLTVRQQMADMARQGYERVTGQSSDHFADTELIDVCFLSVFPNFHPWPLFNRICSLFRPYKDDPDRSWMDVYQLMPFDKKKGRPPAAKVHVLSEDEDWTAAPEIGVYLARISNQDIFNLGPIQEGLKASARKVVNYAKYQESRIRHFHDLLGQWVGQ